MDRMRRLDPGRTCWRRVALLLAAGFCGCLLAAARAAAAGGDDASELERTWAAAPVYLPAPEGYRRIDTAELPNALSERAAPLPGVIYAHGCAGI